MKHPIYDSEWSDEVKAVYEHDMDELWDPSRAPHLFNSYHAELERYLQIAGDQPLRILDVGCAQGTLALLLAEAGHHVTAIDLRQEFLDYAQSRYEAGDIQFLQGNALELQLEGAFDLIFANQILEHLVHPVELISGLADRLTPDGRIVATTPNGGYFKSRLPLFHQLGDVSHYEEQQFFPDGDGHFFAYSLEELRSVFSQAGLDEVCITPYASPWITGHVKVRHLHGWIPVRGLKAMDRAILGIPFLRRILAYQLRGEGRRPND